MRGRWILALVVVMGCMAAATTFWMAPSPRRVSGQERRSYVPDVLAAGTDGDVYVGFRPEDDWWYPIRRFSADGTPLASWMVTATRGWFRYDVAESGDGVFVAMADRDEVRHYAGDGRLTDQWSAGGLQPAIATAQRQGSVDTEVYVLARRPGYEVRQYAPSGDLRRRFDVGPGPVAGDFEPYDIAVGPAAPDHEGEVYVAWFVQNWLSWAYYISRYSLTGTKLAEWQVSDMHVGMDVDAARDRLWIGYERLHVAQAFDRFGIPGPRCELDHPLFGLTVGPGGDLLVGAIGSEPSLVRYRPDCTPIDTWDIQRLTSGPFPAIRWSWLPMAWPASE